MDGHAVPMPRLRGLSGPIRAVPQLGLEARSQAILPLPSCCLRRFRRWPLVAKPLGSMPRSQGPEKACARSAQSSKTTYAIEVEPCTNQWLKMMPTQRHGLSLTIVLTRKWRADAKRCSRWGTGFSPRVGLRQTKRPMASTIRGPILPAGTIASRQRSPGGLSRTMTWSICRTGCT